jgi:uncharacterized membrane protein YeaQ/YmgE (transglycosylase-associated protein family)
MILGQVSLDSCKGILVDGIRLYQRIRTVKDSKKTMGLLSFLLVGLIAGFLAKYVVPGDGPGGILGDLIIGCIGAFIGGWLFNEFGHVGTTGLNLYSILVAFVGAVVLLFILRLLTGRRVA